MKETWDNTATETIEETETTHTLEIKLGVEESVLKDTDYETIVKSMTKDAEEVIRVFVAEMISGLVEPTKEEKLALVEKMRSKS